MFTYLDSAQTALQGMAVTAPYMRNLLLFKEALAEHREENNIGTKPFVFEQSIDFNNVSLAYIPDRAALTDVSFSIKRGMTVGLVGPSGAGKTTFADLLLRLFVPTSGQITVDGVDANTVSLNGWRQNVGYVPQDVFLLNGTIEDNIRFYRPKMAHQTIIAAAKQANIHEFIEALPLRYKTLTGDRGVMLSGGQRQRIALARALAGKPMLLVLDEATSALDTESERLIQEAIKSLRGSITVVIIAHRLSTIEHADMLLVLKDGRIAESGSPAKLHANPDSYLSRHTDL
jgi:ABC-type multidrug transport system fused ATPase/permease subunit